MTRNIYQSIVAAGSHHLEHDLTTGVAGMSVLHIQQGRQWPRYLVNNLLLACHKSKLHAPCRIHTREAGPKQTKKTKTLN